MSEPKTRAERLAELIAERDARLRECRELWLLTPCHGEAPPGVIAKAKEILENEDKERRAELVSGILSRYRGRTDVCLRPCDMVVNAEYVVGMQAEISRLRAEVASMTMHAEGLFGDHISNLANDVRERIARLDRLEKAKGDPS